MRRVLRGLGALLSLLLGMVGVPLALVLLGSDLWPTAWTAEPITRVLLQPDDGRLLLALLTIVGWLAWLVFAVSVVAEATGLLSHQRFRLRVPGLAAPQRFAAALLIAVITLIPTAPVAHADPTPSGPAPDRAPASQAPVTVRELPAPRVVDPSNADGHPAPPAQTAQTGQTAQTAQTGRATENATKDERSALVHTVKPGDDLWSLAEKYYDDGMEWRRIAKANRHVLSGGPDRLEVGWELTIPGAHPTPGGEHRTTTVRRGDTLSSIAERHLGNASRWPELFRANRSVLDDPDELAVGTTLTIPGKHGGTARARDSAPDRLANGQTAGADGRTGPRTAEPPRTNDSDRRGGTDGPPADQGPTSDVARRTTRSVRPPGPSSSRSAQHDAGAPTPPASADVDVPTQPASSGAEAPTKGTRAGAEEPAQGTGGGAGSPTRTTGPGETTAAAALPTESSPGETTARAAGPGETSAAQSRPADTSLAATMPTLVDSSDSSSPLADLSAARLASFAGIGGLVAAGVLAGLAYRRRLQLHARPVGRRIKQPDDEAHEAEVVLGASQRPLDLQAVDTAVRAIGVHCRRTAQPLPRLGLVSFDADSIDLDLTGQLDAAPLGFTPNATGWSVTPSDALYLGSVPGVEEAIRPYPTLVGLGSDDRSRSVLVNLEELGLLSLAGDRRRVDDLLAAMTLELAFAPWADEMILTVVGDRGGLPDVLDKHNVTTTDDVDALLDHLESRARAQREERPDGPAGHFRIDPDLSDPWSPEVVLIGRPLDAAQQQRFVALVADEPPPTVAVVVAGEVAGARWTLRLGPTDAVLEPVGLGLTPQQLPGAAEDTLVSLVAATGSLQTTPAPWWVDDTEPPDPPPDRSDGDNIAYLARRSAGWATRSDDRNGRDMAQNPVIARDLPPDHPVLLLLGPIDLVGSRGQLPPRAAKQCLEYCGWLLEHPGTTAQAMGSALLVAEGTRRSNMSRLRTWLGADEDGQAYLPDAYSGRILLHASVSSDWQRLQILTAAGVNRTSDSGLRSALELVRGAPLADAAPGQWHWAEELRTDMSSAVRDIGVELAGRANEAGDLEIARWAAARALAAAPGDELLMTARIRTEHLAGNRAATERLTLQLAAQARTLGVDLDPETVELLQQVMEGQVRARLA